MAISVKLISSDSSDESVGSSLSQIILFGTIPAEIPIETPTIPSVVPTLPHNSSFLVAARSSTPTQDLPHAVRWILPAPPGLPRRPAILVLPGQPIPFGRPYRTQPDRVRKMLTARKRIRVLPVCRLASRYPPDRHSLPDSSFDAPTTIFAEPSRKRYRSHVASVPLATPVPGTLSPVHADLLLPCYIAMEVDVEVEIGTEIEREDEREQRCRMLAASEQRSGILDRIRVLERDNMRLRGMLCVERETMPTATRTEMTPAAIEKMIERRVAEALEAYEANINRGPTMESGDEREDDNGGNHGNGIGNENGLNGDGNPNLNTRGVVPVTRECTY
nr:hypothetical protein [Tanacetum cinerariifolium]